MSFGRDRAIPATTVREMSMHHCTTRAGGRGYADGNGLPIIVFPEKGLE